MGAVARYCKLARPQAQYYLVAILSSRLSHAQTAVSKRRPRLKR
jgi:hypothetical protein